MDVHEDSVSPHTLLARLWHLNLHVNHFFLKFMHWPRFMNLFASNCQKDCYVIWYNGAHVNVIMGDRTILSVECGALCSFDHFFSRLS